MVQGTSFRYDSASRQFSCACEDTASPLTADPAERNTQSSIVWKSLFDRSVSSSGRCRELIVANCEVIDPRRVRRLINNTVSADEFVNRRYRRRDTAKSTIKGDVYGTRLTQMIRPIDRRYPLARVSTFQCHAARSRCSDFASNGVKQRVSNLQFCNFYCK